MKKYIIPIVIFALLKINFVYAQTWQWAQSAGGFGQDDGTNLCTDQNGNYYITGSMMMTCYFQTDTFISNGTNDMFIAKYDANGSEIWAKQFGGPNTSTINIKSEAICDLIYDSFGNCIYATGGFYEMCVFGNDTFLVQIESPVFHRDSVALLLNGISVIFQSMH